MMTNYLHRNSDGTTEEKILTNMETVDLSDRFQVSAIIAYSFDNAKDSHKEESDAFFLEIPKKEINTKNKDKDSDYYELKDGSSITFLFL